MLLAFELHELGTVIGLALGILTLAGLGYAVATRLAKLELKVDTIWEFQIRRAFAEAVEKGVATMNSPIRIRPEALEMMQALAPVLQEFYRTGGRDLTDGELMLEIERRFGDQILKQVCIPYSFNQGACLLIAAQVAKLAEGMGPRPMELPPQAGSGPGSGIRVLPGTFRLRKQEPPEAPKS